MRLLALDQASRTSGYAIFDGNLLLEAGAFTYEDQDLAQRLVKIKNKINQLVEQFQVDQIIMEDIQLQSNVGNNVITYKALAEVYGVIQEYAAEHKIPCQSVLATVWKSKVGIKGRTRPEQKKAAQEYVLAQYRKNVSQDTADAICIGTYGLM